MIKKIIKISILTSIITGCGSVNNSTENTNTQNQIPSYYIMQTNNKKILVITKPNIDIDVNLSEINTIKCNDLNSGDTFIINGIVYTAVDNFSLFGIDKVTGDFVHICTSKVTDMSSLFYQVTDFNQSTNGTHLM